MKKIKFVILGTIALMTIVGIISTTPSEQAGRLSDIALSNIEALANNDGENQQKNVYSYTIWENSECYVLVGGAYAKGKQVSCFSGSEHPVCVTCKL